MEVTSIPSVMVSATDTFVPRSNCPTITQLPAATVTVVWPLTVNVKSVPPATPLPATLQIVNWPVSAYAGLARPPATAARTTADSVKTSALAPSPLTSRFITLHPLDGWTLSGRASAARAPDRPQKRVDPLATSSQRALTAARGTPAYRMAPNLHRFGFSRSREDHVADDRGRHEAGGQPREPYARPRG